MNADDLDRQFEERLRTLAEQWRMTMVTSDQLHEVCGSSLSAGRNHGQRMRAWRNRTIFSTMGLAAVITLILTLCFPPGGNSPVLAKTVLAKLAEQVQGNDVLEITLDEVSVEEAQIQGRLQIADHAIAGDIQLRVQEHANELPIEIDASLALSPSRSWVLVRNLAVPDATAQAVIRMFVAADSPALIMLPEGLGETLNIDAEGVPLAELRKMASGELAQFVREVLDSKADLGAVTTRQADGSTRLTLHVKNAEVLRRLIALGAKVAGEHADGKIEIGEGDADELVGCTLAVTYDPQSLSVRSFSISDIAEMKGTITIALRAGGIDAALLDPARVTTPNTRTIDAGFLKSILETVGKEKK